ncbi:aconitase family domain-containing protein [Trichoderma sp. SZMC 28014]
MAGTHWSSPSATETTTWSTTSCNTSVLILTSTNMRLLRRAVRGLILTLITCLPSRASKIWRGLFQHEEVYKFLSSAGKKYGIGWWKPGAGIIHVTIFGNYAFPGGLIIGTDSHTPNAGGLVSGGKGKVFEFFGPGTEALSATGMATVCNMSAEIGSTSCIFPFTDSMARYLSATKRSGIAQLANSYKDVLFRPDEATHINGPFTPDLSHPLSQMKDAVRRSDWPAEISHAMVGSCTNSSCEDLYKTQQLVKQAKAAGIHRVKIPFMVAPGSEDIRATAEADAVLSSTCGPCVGQWDRTDVDVKGRERNTVVSSFNRNFVGRHDGNPETCSFMTSPEMVTAFAYAGRIDFNPAIDALPVSGSQQEFRFTAPTSVELPSRFTTCQDLYQPPQENSAHLQVDIDPKSDRLQLLQPFKPWQPGAMTDMPILIKVRGKCTTDHISPAGPWYKYRGHLENISHNMLLAASNAFLPPTSTMLGHTIHHLDGSVELIHKAARDLQRHNMPWCIIGDWNYGEGSSREHAALETRYLGGLTIISRSFARIHETNLKNQGMLPLTFAEPADNDRIQQGDRITLRGVEEGELRPALTVVMHVQMKNGEVWDCDLKHTYSRGQLRWLREGSALNSMREQVASK